MMASFRGLCLSLASPIEFLQQYANLTVSTVVVCTLSAFFLLVLGDRTRLRREAVILRGGSGSGRLLRASPPYWCRPSLILEPRA